MRVGFTAISSDRALSDHGAGRRIFAMSLSRSPVRRVLSGGLGAGQLLFHPPSRGALRVQDSGHPFDWFACVVIELIVWAIVPPLGNGLYAHRCAL